MRKNVLFYGVAVALLVVVFIFFTTSYPHLTRYSELMNRYNTVRASFQNLSKKINDAAVINPDLIRSGRSPLVERLISTDSLSIIHELDVLKLNIRDSINRQIISKLDAEVKSELSWIINSNVPDSIIQHKALQHLAAFGNIHLLIDNGVRRIGTLIDYQKKQQQTAIRTVKLWMIVFIILSGILIIYTTVNLFKQEEKTKIKEIELQKSEKRFRALIEYGHDIISLLDENLKPYYRTPSAERITGYTSEERSRTSGSEHVHPDDAEKVRKSFEEVKANPGKKINLRFRFRHKDGHYMWLESTQTNLLNDPDVGAIVVNMREVTERYKAEEALEKNRLSLTEAQRMAHLGSWEWDSVTDTATWSEELYRIFGRDPKLPAPNLEEGKESYSLKDRKIIDEAIEAALTNGTPFKIETKIKQPSGKEVWILSIAEPVVDAHGSITGIRGTVQDITEQKEAQEKIKLQAGLIDISFDAIFVWELDGKIIFWNEGAKDLYGFAADEAIGKVSHDLLQTKHSRGIDFFKNRLRQATIWRGELKHVTKDGKSIIVESRQRLVENADARMLVVETNRDITERKQAEQRDAMLASIVNSSEDAIIGKTLSGIITSWNNSAERIFGYTTNEMIGESIMKIIPDHLKREELEILERLKKGQPIKHFETQRISKEGKLLDVFMTISPIKNSVGEITGISNIARDITERKKADEKINQLNKEIEKSEKKFRGLIENSYDMVGIVNEKSEILYRSPSATRMTGWSDEEIKKINRIELMHPDDVGAFMQTTLQVLANPGKPFPLRFRSRHKDGHYIWIEGTSTNMLHDESIKGIVANFRDITQAKEAEEKLMKSEKIYRTIASSIPGSVIVLIDHDYRYLLVEGDMLEKFGYVKEDLLGKRAEEVLPNERFETMLPLFKRVFEGEAFSDEINRAGYDIIRRFVPLKDENNFVYAAMIVSIDITELKNAQQQILELNRGLEEKIIERTEELRKTNEELESFSYSVSHDLRSPLRAVGGFAKILEEEYHNVLDDEGKRLLTVVRENAKKMGLLIDDLLSFSRLGRKEIHKTKVDMKTLAENIADEFKSSLNGKVEIKISDLHSAMADSALINQALMNLISNAVKYSSEKEKSVIEIISEKQNGEIIFSVSDNGIGFDMQYAPKLFGVFQRLHSDEKFEGTGVGLAIVHRIIMRHGGRVWATGKPGEGATFYFSLPDYETIKNN